MKQLGSNKNNGPAIAQRRKIDRYLATKEMNKETIEFDKMIKENQKKKYIKTSMSSAEKEHGRFWNRKRSSFIARITVNTS